jgi:hypothetical protein
MSFSLLIRTAEDLSAQAREVLKEFIRARRDTAISAGITFGGVAVHTDDLSQQRITGAALAATIDPTMVVRWKTADGAFVTLDAPTVVAVAQAVRAHVQACFDREAELRAAVDAGEEFDIDTGWPSGT